MQNFFFKVKIHSNVDSLSSQSNVVVSTALKFNTYFNCPYLFSFLQFSTLISLIFFKRNGQQDSIPIDCFLSTCKIVSL